MRRKSKLGVLKTAAIALGLLLCWSTLIITLSSANAQIFELPDCNIEPQDPFCQAQCRFTFPKPPWCTQPTPSPSPTLTPTPTPTKDPIIIIPGITVSQNKKLLYSDQGGGQWKFALGYNVYKGLIKKLEEAGYEEGKDLLVAHYDWRKPAAHNATNYLKPIVNQAKQNTGANKVDIVAHSFGGVVSRAYIQGDSYTNDVDQLVTLGTPHRGSSDAYMAWEGGVYPEGWTFPIRYRIDQVEKALKKTHNTKDMRRPESFRTYFPSLHDMLPLNDFIRQDGEIVAITELTEKNNWLQSLNDAFNTAVIKLTTIAGNQEQTLDKINLTDNRTHEDEVLNRWRDGHPNPETPPLDSVAGDARVLLSSAHIGDNNITKLNAEHHKLTDAAQNEVLEILSLNAVAEQFETNEPKKIFGITILSPLSAVITGPNGQVLSINQNDFGDDNAEYDDDPNDPDDPVDITILDPPDGWYELQYTGTGTGDYTIIASYADDDETVSSTQEGETYPSQIKTEEIYIGGSTVSLIDDSDYKALLETIMELAKQGKKDKLLKGFEQANITRPVIHAQNDLRFYEHRMKDGRESAALTRLRSYYENLNELERTVKALGRRKALADLSNEILQLIEKIKVYSPPLS